MLLGIGLVIGIIFVLVKVFEDAPNWNHDGWDNDKKFTGNDALGCMAGKAIADTITKKGGR